MSAYVTIQNDLYQEMGSLESSAKTMLYGHIYKALHVRKPTQQYGAVISIGAKGSMQCQC